MSYSSPSISVQQQEIKPLTITKINLSEADQAELKRVLTSNRIASYSKEMRQRTIVGICADCGSIPDFIVTRYYEGIQKIERYCKECLEKEKEK